MRKAALILLLVGLFAVPTVAQAVERAEGRLSVSDGRGVVSMHGRGSMIGRLEKGTVTVIDLSPVDASEPLVFGCDQEEFRGTATVCQGENLRFRLLGGSWRITINGSGIDVSAAARGTVRLDGKGLRPGFYSTAGVDCRKAVASCEPLPDEPLTLLLGKS